MIVEFENQRHEFPDDVSPDEIAQALSGHTGQPLSYFENLKRTFGEAVERTKRGGGQLAQGAREWRADLANPQPGMQTHDPGEGYGFAPLDIVAGATNVGLGALGALGAPINAAIDQYVGQNVEKATGIPAGVTDFAVGLALPGPKRLPAVTARMAEVAQPERVLVESAAGPTRGVGLSEGQATGDLSKIQREQAERSQHGAAYARGAQPLNQSERRGHFYVAG